ncbi:MAG: hypothetical protein H7330_03430 [Hymenobacteraceae bacterium]|nr:hypothetical protein [Hymenobacteraceae bacterium]
MNLSVLDFQQARIKQVLFKSRLRSVLYGVRQADDSLFVAQHNPMAEWLRTVMKPQYGRHPEVGEIERQLLQMLKVGQELTNQYRRGLIEEARAGLSRIDVHADRITTLLQTLETRVS